eukprot:UN18286
MKRKIWNVFRKSSSNFAKFIFDARQNFHSTWALVCAINYTHSRSV